MHAFHYGAPAKLHAPGRPWHKIKVRLIKETEPGRWDVSVRRWGRKALRANPAVGAISRISVLTEHLRLLPTLDRDVPANQPNQGSAPQPQPGHKRGQGEGGEGED